MVTLHVAQQLSVVVLRAGAVGVDCGAAARQQGVGSAAGRAATVESESTAGGIAVCSGSSTVQASGDDSRSSVELGLSIDR